MDNEGATIGDDVSAASVSRRKLLATGLAVGGAAWATPTILGFERAFALGSGGPPAVTAGTAASHTNNGNDFPTATLPTGGPFTMYLLVVSSESVTSGAPTISGTGWTTTPVVTEAGPSGWPGLYVYVGSAASGPVAVSGSNVKKDNFTVQVFGLTSGTAASAGTVKSGSGGTVSSVAGLSGQPAGSGYVLIAGSATGASSTTNWTTPAGYTSVSDLGSLGSSLPDIYFAVYNSVGTSVPGITTLGYTSGSGNAQAVQVRIS